MKNGLLMTIVLIVIGYIVGVNFPGWYSRLGLPRVAG